MGWRELLEDIERRLADVDRELSTGGPAVSRFDMPDNLGPLPADLRQRAKNALRDTQAKQAQAEAAATGWPRRSARVGSTPGSRPPTSTPGSDRPAVRLRATIYSRTSISRGHEGSLTAPR